VGAFWWSLINLLSQSRKAVIARRAQTLSPIEVAAAEVLEKNQ
jgi:hypothetical protein